MPAEDVASLKVFALSGARLITGRLTCLRCRYASTSNTAPELARKIASGQRAGSAAASTVISSPPNSRPRPAAVMMAPGQSMGSSLARTSEGTNFAISASAKNPAED